MRSNVKSNPSSSYLDWMSRYFPNLWRLRADLILLFIVIGFVYSSCGVLLLKSDSLVYQKAESNSYFPSQFDASSADTDSSQNSASSDQTTGPVTDGTATHHLEPAYCESIVSHVSVLGFRVAGSDWKDSGYSRAVPSIVSHAKANDLDLRILETPDVENSADVSVAYSNPDNPNVEVFNPMACGTMQRSALPILGVSGVDAMIVGAWVLPSIFLLILSYAISRSVRLREVAGLRQRPHFTVLTLANLLTMLPFTIFAALASYVDSSSALVLIPAYSVTASVFLALVVRAVTLSKVSTTIYAALSAMIACGVNILICMFIGSISSLDPSLELWMGLALFVCLMNAPALYIWLARYRRGPGRLFGIIALFCTTCSALLILSLCISGREYLAEALMITDHTASGYISLIITIAGIIAFFALIEVCSALIVKRDAMPRKN